MNKKSITLLVFIIFLFYECIHVRPISENLKLQSHNLIFIKELSTQKPNIGSPKYVNDISETAKRKGAKTALNRIMKDVEKNVGEIDNNDSETNLRLYRLVSSLVYKIGYVDVRTHYFRNRLNKVPKSLNELLYLNSRLPSEKRWKLIPEKNSLYHMQGNDGEYNLKFVSWEGFCEAVYNKNGILLTEENNPINMGTFNYCAGINEPDAHRKFDVVPYLNSGNSPNSPQKGKDDIIKGVDLALKKYEQNNFKILEYRKKILKIIDSGSI